MWFLIYCREYREGKNTRVVIDNQKAQKNLTVKSLLLLSLVRSTFLSLGVKAPVILKAIFITTHFSTSDSDWEGIQKAYTPFPFPFPRCILEIRVFSMGFLVCAGLWGCWETSSAPFSPLLSLGSQFESYGPPSFPVIMQHGWSRYSYQEKRSCSVKGRGNVFETC